MFVPFSRSALAQMVTDIKVGSPRRHISSLCKEQTFIYGCQPGFPACSGSAGERWWRPSGEQQDGWLDAAVAVRARIRQA